MDPKFALRVEDLAPKLARLVAMLPLRDGALLLVMSKSGVYLFTEAGRHLYVGRSNNLRGRKASRMCGATSSAAALPAP